MSLSVVVESPIASAVIDRFAPVVFRVEGVNPGYADVNVTLRYADGRTERVRELGAFAPLFRGSTVTGDDDLVFTLRRVGGWTETFTLDVEAVSTLGIGVTIAPDFAIDLDVIKPITVDVAGGGSITIEMEAWPIEDSLGAYAYGLPGGLLPASGLPATATQWVNETAAGGDLDQVWSTPEVVADGASLALRLNPTDNAANGECVYNAGDTADPTAVSLVALIKFTGTPRASSTFSGVGVALNVATSGLVAGLGIGVNGSNWGAVIWGVAFLDSGDAITNDVWHVLLATGNGTETKLYLDGTEIGSGAAMLGITNAQIFAGAANAIAQYQVDSCLLKRWAVFDRVLDATEIEAITDYYLLRASL